jgi:hypothetical protein
MSAEEKKRQDERHQRILKKMLNEDPNKFCADCGAKGIVLLSVPRCWD